MVGAGRAARRPHAGRSVRQRRAGQHRAVVAARHLDRALPGPARVADARGLARGRSPPRVVDVHVVAVAMGRRLGSAVRPGVGVAVDRHRRCRGGDHDHPGATRAAPRGERSVGDRDGGPGAAQPHERGDQQRLHPAPGAARDPRGGRDALRGSAADALRDRHQSRPRRPAPAPRRPGQPPALRARPELPQPRGRLDTPYGGGMSRIAVVGGHGQVARHLLVDAAPLGARPGRARATRGVPRRARVARRRGAAARHRAARTPTRSRPRSRAATRWSSRPAAAPTATSSASAPSTSRGR